MSIESVSAQVFELALASSTEAAIVTDEKLRIIWLNEAWTKLFGYSREEALGHTPALIRGPYSDTATYAQIWSQLLDPSQGAWRGELINRSKAGEEIPVMLSISSVFQKGERVAFIGLLLDLRERKEIEELKRLYEMVVRHDLKAPLAAMQSLLSILVQGYAGALSEKQTEMLERAQGQAAQMTALIETSLDLEKLRRRTLKLELQPHSPLPILEQSIRTLEAQAARAGVEVVLEPSTDALHIGIDPTHFQRCTDNLIKNAIEASPNGAAVRIRCFRDSVDVVLQVHNLGAPIPANIRATLFHPFSTYGKRGGTGLGIYGVKLLSEAMGGSIAYSSDEQGTVFELRFPWVAQA
ncbi:MAG: PAS domain-containing sensor histidine kinase [Myxococcota bacterium]|jgi:PAS domain S-box-containing protein|nr:PAS domain-containing sensor histidine kinase [Myxococcota bacterium]